MKRRLARAERVFVKNEYADHTLYRALRTPALEMERQMEHLQLSPEELFVETLSVLDDIKRDIRRSGKDARFNLRNVWNDRYQTLRELSGSQVTAEELSLAVSELLYMVMSCLQLMEHPAYNTLAMDLLMLLQEEDLRHLDTVRGAFVLNISRLGPEQLDGWMQEYTEDVNSLSEELENRLAELKAETGSGVTAVEERKSPLHISDGKFSLVAAVMDAMFLDGCFVDENGQKPSNRKAQLCDILRTAFNADEDKLKNLDQSLTPIRNDDSRFSGYMKRLEKAWQKNTSKDDKYFEKGKRP